MQSFEKTAGLTDTGYTPHKGLTAEESHYYRMTQSMQVGLYHKSEIRASRKFGFLDRSVTSVFFVISCRNCTCIMLTLKRRSSHPQLSRHHQELLSLPPNRSVGTQSELS